MDRSLADAAAPLVKERVGRLDEIPGLLEFLFGWDAPEYDTSLLAERMGGDTDAAVRVLDEALVALDAVSEADWTVENVEAAVRSLQDPLGLKLRKFVSVLYVASMGRPQGIPLFDSLVLLGRERSMARLRAARARLG
ncbi:MAG: hypothetical protein U5Q44_01680 [Dehalococcoidia bacterium]|nr:hypothetical protein [Dehalococcoidia bacterium]